MDPWKYAVIWLVPGCLIIGMCLTQGGWKKRPWLFLAWCPLALAFGPFFLAGLAYFHTRH